MGHTGLCPGKVILDDGTETLAYRFVKLSPEEAERLAGELDEIIDDLRSGT
jgi:hypothetical protein